MIRNIVAIATIAFCAYAPMAAAQAVDSVIDSSVVDSGGMDGVTVNANDTVDIINAVNTTNDTTVDIAEDIAGGKDVINLDDEELMRAALAVDSTAPAAPTQKLDLIRREYEYRRQTRAAIVMMVFIAAAMATSQSWNPK
jgi:hypothetical protein